MNLKRLSNQVKEKLKLINERAANDSSYDMKITNIALTSPASKISTRPRVGGAVVVIRPLLCPKDYSEVLQTLANKISDQTGMTEKEIWGGLAFVFGDKDRAHRDKVNDIQEQILSLLVADSGGDIKLSSVEKWASKLACDLKVTNGLTTAY